MDENETAKPENQNDQKNVQSEHYLFYCNQQQSHISGRESCNL